MRQTEEAVRKIMVLQTNGLGELIFAMPALWALRVAYPGAELVLLARDWHRAFLHGRPSPIDRVEVIPPSRAILEETSSDDPDELARFIKRMRREQFDIAVQLHDGGLKTNPFILNLDAKLTVGLKAPDAVALDRWVPYVSFQPVVLRGLEVVAQVGAGPVELEPRVTVTEADRAEAERVCPSASRPLAVLHPGSGDPRRRWPIEKFATVGDALAAAGARVAVVGTQPERDLVAAVVGTMYSDAEGLSGRLSLGALAGLLSRCQVVVANDSGPLHLAAAVGAPTVGIYWCGNLLNVGPLTCGSHRPAIAWRLACPVCGIACTDEGCSHEESFVADVSVEEVALAALDLLSRHAVLRPAEGPALYPVGGTLPSVVGRLSSLLDEARDRRNGIADRRRLMARPAWAAA